MMKSSLSIARVGSLLIFFVTLSFTLGACFLPGEPMLYITVHNRTDETLKIFNDDVFIDNAAPKGGVKFEIDGIYQKYKIVAKDMEGNVVYATTFTRDDIIVKNYKYDVYFPPTGKDAESSDNVSVK